MINPYRHLDGGPRQNNKREKYCILPNSGIFMESALVLKVGNYHGNCQRYLGLNYNVVCFLMQIRCR